MFVTGNMETGTYLYASSPGIEPEYLVFQTSALPTKL